MKVRLADLVTTGRTFSSIYIPDGWRCRIVSHWECLNDGESYTHTSWHDILLDSAKVPACLQMLVKSPKPAFTCPNETIAPTGQNKPSESARPKS